VNRPLSTAVASFLATASLAFGQATTNSFFNWETPPVHPVALSPDGTRLVVCNLPDNRLEVFSVTNGAPVALGNVSVGLDPTTARFRTDDEVWVANFISDSISIVSLSGMRVVATLSVSNEPSDIAFAGSPQRAFVTCAQPGIVQVFDATNRAAITNLVIDGNRPKAMAVSPDGNTVYAAIFESGNNSTIIGAGVNLGLPPPTPVDFPNSPHGGQNPPPNRGTNFSPAINSAISNLPPRVGLIVKKNSAGQWMDDNDGDWTAFINGTNSIFSGRPVGWDLHDHDLAVIDANTFGIRYAKGLMNICMDVAVNPASGRIAVIGTEALNHIRFEPELKSIFVRVQLASVDPEALTNQVTDLNPHLDYIERLLPESERAKSLGDPRGIVWSSDGTRGYVTGMGSGNLAIINPAGQRIGTNAALALGKGPTGMVLDEARNRLYVLNRFDATLSVVDTTTESVVGTVPLFDPTPTVIRSGRPHLYDTHKTSGLGQVACGSCHVDARFDRLAWDLGAPNGSMKFLTNVNFGLIQPAVTNHFHPMKGPTTTQTLQDIIGHEPFHWRGDQFGLEEFSGTFTNLQGAPVTLTTNEMQEFENFLATVRFAPNPFRTLSNTLPTNLPLPGQKALGRGVRPSGTQLPNGNAVFGQTRFRQPGAAGCIECHTLPSGVGVDMRWTGFQWAPIPAGPHGERHNAFVAIERSSILPFKIQSLRNLFDKFGLDFQQTTNRAGFGFFHDGSVDSLTRFIQDGFDFRDDQDTANMVAFLLAFSGSDLLPGSISDQNRPPGAPSLDTHAAVGRQITINSSATVPLIDTFVSIATPVASRVDLVVKGFKDGQPRGWFLNRTNGLFQSDRLTETLTSPALRAFAGVGNELTFTAVPRGSGVRIGVDRDEDGYFDRDELDFGSDPANAQSLATNRPPALAPLPDQIVFLGQTISFTAAAADPDIPGQQLAFSLGAGSPAGAVIHAASGVFAWTPDAPGTNTIKIVVTDNGSPNQTDTKSFTVTALELRAGAPVLDTNGMTLSWATLSGFRFRVQMKTNLTDAEWTDLAGVITATNGVVTVNDPAIYPQRFYRLLLVP
jgi:YVTN family beta-propeller protein